MSRVGYAQECRDAARDVKDSLDAKGHNVTFYIRDEGDIRRDKYNTINRRPSERPVKVRAQLDTNPSDQQREAAGLFEQASLQAWTAALDWQRAGLDFGDLDIKRMSVIIDNSTYDVSEKGRSGACGDAWLYHTFGLSRR